MNRQAGGNEQKKEGNQERKADPKRDDSSSEDPREDDVDGRQDEKKPTVYQRFTDSLESVLQQVVNAGTAHVGGSQPKKLSAFTLDGIAKFIQDGHARKIIVMTGAGISTSAGIPDFRSPNSGLYAKLAATATDLGDPTDMFSIDFFRRDPVPFYRRARDIFPETAKPTPAHHFVRLIEKKGLLLRWFTQANEQSFRLKNSDAIVNFEPTPWTGKSDELTLGVRYASGKTQGHIFQLIAQSPSSDEIVANLTAGLARSSIKISLQNAKGRTLLIRAFQNRFTFPDADTERSIVVRLRPGDSTLHVSFDAKSTGGEEYRLKAPISLAGTTLDLSFGNGADSLEGCVTLVVLGEHDGEKLKPLGGSLAPPKYLHNASIGCKPEDEKKKSEELPPPPPPPPPKKESGPKETKEKSEDKEPPLPMKPADDDKSREVEEDDESDPPQSPVASDDTEAGQPEDAPADSKSKAASDDTEVRQPKVVPADPKTAGTSGQKGKEENAEAGASSNFWTVWVPVLLFLLAIPLVLLILCTISKCNKQKNNSNYTAGQRQNP